MSRVALALLPLVILACTRPQAGNPQAGYGSRVSVTPWLKTSTTASGAPMAWPLGQGEVTMAEVVLAPGASTGWHVHPIPVFAFLLEGTLEVALEGGQTRTYHRGQAIAEVVNIRHNGINRSPGPVRLLVAYCGVKGEPTTLRD